MGTTQIKDGYQGGSDNQLKVNPDGSINVNTSGGGSNTVRIEDTNGDPLTSTNGSLNVNITSGFVSQNVVVSYNQVSAIAVGVETNINSYMAPVGKIAYLLSITCSGENRGQFNIYNNGVAFDTQYTNVTQLSGIFDYKTGASLVPGFVIPVGNTILVTATNAGSTTAMYNARFLILEVA